MVFMRLLAMVAFLEGAAGSYSPIPGGGGYNPIPGGGGGGSLVPTTCPFASGGGSIKITRSRRPTTCGSCSRNSGTIKFYFDVETHVPSVCSALKPRVKFFQVAECRPEHCIGRVQCSSIELSTTHGFSCSPPISSSLHSASYCGSVDLHRVTSRTSLCSRGHVFSACVQVAIIDESFGSSFFLFQDERIFKFDLQKIIHSSITVTKTLTTTIYTENIHPAVLPPAIIVIPPGGPKIVPIIFICEQRHGMFFRVDHDSGHRCGKNRVLTLCIAGSSSHTRITKITTLSLRVDRSSCNICQHSELCPVDSSAHAGLTLIGGHGSTPLRDSHARTDLRPDSPICAAKSGGSCPQSQHRVGYGVSVRLASIYFSGCKITATVTATVTSTTIGSSHSGTGSIHGVIGGGSYGGKAVGNY